MYWVIGLISFHARILTSLTCLFSGRDCQPKLHQILELCQRKKKKSCFAFATVQKSQKNRESPRLYGKVFFCKQAHWTLPAIFLVLKKKLSNFPIIRTFCLKPSLFAIFKENADDFYIFAFLFFSYGPIWDFLSSGVLSSMPPFTITLANILEF